MYETVIKFAAVIDFNDLTDEFKSHSSSLDDLKVNPPKGKDSYELMYGSGFMYNISKEVTERIESTMVWNYDWL